MRNTQARSANRFAAWIQACGLIFIVAGMVLAQGAAMLNFASKMMSSPSAATILGGFVAYLALAAAGLASLRWVYRHAGPGIFLWVALGLSMMIQASAILATDPNWKWTNDAQIFRHYLTRLSETGYTQETLGELSQNYDYRAWTRRALPFYYALHRWTDGHFIPAVQIFQALVMTLSIALTWRIARLLFGRPVAFWAVSLQFLMPFRWFTCIDLNHHILGGTYFLVGLWLLAEWYRRPPPARRAWGLVLCAGALLPLMRLEGGIDLVYWMAVLWVLILIYCSGRRDARRTVWTAGVFLAWPMMVSILVLSPLNRRMEQAHPQLSDAGWVAFMARGWAPETGGEYCYTYERIDYLTPARDKKSMQSSILASQAYYNPRALFFQLLPVKFAKYFLLGYAAGAEEMLDLNGARRLKLLAEGARTAFLLAALPLMIWGGMLLLPLLRRTNRVHLVLPCSLICATYVLLGETSPRYSIYVQPFLFMLGALPLAWGVRRQRRLLSSGCIPSLVAVASCFAVFLLAAGILLAARPWLHRYTLQDMRRWTPLPDSQPLSVPATLAPFEIHLAPQMHESGTEWGSVRLPEVPGTSGVISFYAIPSDAPSGLLQDVLLITECSVENGFQILTNSLPGRIHLEYSPSPRGVLKLRASAPLPYPLHIGYATYKHREKTAD